MGSNRCWVHNMAFVRIQAICMFSLALLQLASALLLVYWAFPLLADPPVLGNGIAAVSHELSRLVAKHPIEFERVKWVPEHLRWLFQRHSEGVFFVLGAALALFGSATVTVLFTCLQLFRGTGKS